MTSNIIATWGSFFHLGGTGRFFAYHGDLTNLQELSNLPQCQLNPQWAVNAIYEIMKHKDVKEKNQGRFDQALLKKVWTEKGFNPDEQAKLLNLMLKNNLEVCFQAREEGRTIYIAPPPTAAGRAPRRPRLAGNPGNPALCVSLPLHAQGTHRQAHRPAARAHREPGATENRVVKGHGAEKRPQPGAGPTH